MEDLNCEDVMKMKCILDYINDILPNTYNKHVKSFLIYMNEGFYVVETFQGT